MNIVTQNQLKKNGNIYYFSHNFNDRNLKQYIIKKINYFQFMGRTKSFFVYILFFWHQNNSLSINEVSKYVNSIYQILMMKFQFFIIYVNSIQVPCNLMSIYKSRISHLLFRFFRKRKNLLFNSSTKYSLNLVSIKIQKPPRKIVVNNSSSTCIFSFNAFLITRK